VLASNLLFNTLVMRYPFAGERVRYAEYFGGTAKTHGVGMLGGAIWCLGSLASYIASGPAGTAISYGLGQGATMVAAFWGVFIWREFRGGTRRVNLLIALMFVLFLTGLGLIILAGN
jgi:glucose uptake protein